jgi:hypothetical protein
MVDITICIQEACGLKDSCYRYLAKPDPLHQSMWSFQPNYQMTDGWTCDGYMPAEGCMSEGDCKYHPGNRCLRINWETADCAACSMLPIVTKI